LRSVDRPSPPDLLPLAGVDVGELRKVAGICQAVGFAVAQPDQRKWPGGRNTVMNDPDQTFALRTRYIGVEQLGVVTIRRSGLHVEHTTKKRCTPGRQPG